MDAGVDRWFQTRSTTCIPVGVDRLFPTRSTTYIPVGESAQGGNVIFTLPQNLMTCVINFGGTSLCRTETPIKSEFP